MNCCYIDIHIHTSENADSLNESYDVIELKRKVEKIAKGYPYLISLSDHNVINVNAYKNLAQLNINFIVGVELHVRNFEDCPPYHCHALFNIDDDILKDETKLVDELNKINSLLSQLYPKKMVCNTDNIPTIHDIISKFVKYDLLILPHGGQSHSTFDESVRNNNTQFDSVLERSLYYNLFDGFTSRSNKGLQRTIDYFTKMGINEFVNLLTCTDNYDVKKYPSDKNGNDDFVPTWMYSSPTFDGLRIALSEKSRLLYADEPVDDWQEKIISAKINNDKIDIDVKFEPGLNVIIGNSSTGKTLLVDSMYNIINKTPDKCKYISSFNLNSMQINNPSAICPHYFSQNYIIELIKPTIDGKSNSLGDNELLKKIFPFDSTFQREINLKLSKFKQELDILIDSVKNIELERNKIKNIQSFYRLIVNGSIVSNPIKPFKLTQSEKDRIDIKDSDLDLNNESLDKIVDFSKKLAFCESIESEVASIKRKFLNAEKEIDFAKKINELIDYEIKFEDASISENDTKNKVLLDNWNNLLDSVYNYLLNCKKFENSLRSLSTYNYSCKTKEICSAGHKLFISNSLHISKDLLLNTFNKFLKTNEKLSNFDSIVPEQLFRCHFSKRSPNVIDYDDFSNKIYNEISSSNNVSYDIIHKNGKPFSDLTPRLKASVSLDIILGYEDDNAPLIIDQPEDNLATSYINHDLIRSIKNCKKKRQIIIVSHNATIPMLGDAQNIIICSNDDKIKIKSYKMEDYFDKKTSVLDVIASITDGGKQSIKKRFKKYNMKSYKGEKDEN